jgi:hypothetical protein
MSETATSLISPARVAPKRNHWALLTIPAIGCAVTVANGIAALIVTAVIGSIFVGYEPSPHQPANAWANAHATDVYLTSHPLLLAAWCALIVAAAGAVTFRHRLPAALQGKIVVTLLLCAAAVMPWIPAMAFLHHMALLTPAP